jgi:hypothetical protein
MRQLASDAEQRYLAAVARARLRRPAPPLEAVATRYGARDTQGVSVFRESLIQTGSLQGKEGVDGSSPSEGSAKATQIAAFPVE